MKRVIFYFILILLAVLLGLQIYQHPGYVLIFYREWALESTVWFLALMLIVSFLIFYLLLAILNRTFHLPALIERWWLNRTSRKAVRLHVKGYQDYISGKYKQAEKNLLKSAKQKKLALTNYLIAAQVADDAGDSVKREQYLGRASAVQGLTNQVTDVLRAKMLLSHNQPHDALPILLKLRDSKPKDPYLLKLYAEGLLRAEDFRQLEKLLPEIKKKNIFDSSAIKAIERETYVSCLNESFEDFNAVQKLWSRVPAYLQYDADILIAYCNLLISWGHPAEAEQLIRKALKKQYDSQLFDYYSKTPPKDPAKQIALGEKIVKEHPDDAIVLSAMGKLCLQNKLWGQARDYFEASLKYKPSYEINSALGYIYEKLGDEERALRYYRRGLSFIPKDQLPIKLSERDVDKRR